MNYDKIKDSIKTHEGYRDKVYRDHLGNRTVGYGHLCLDNEKWSDSKVYPRKVLDQTFDYDFNMGTYRGLYRRGLLEAFQYESSSLGTGEVVPQEADARSGQTRRGYGCIGAPADESVDQEGYRDDGANARGEAVHDINQIYSVDDGDDP